MRLTLRTLLAYLDDTLDPAETLEIGRKVAENEPARELVDRIKKSQRKRSLAVPVSQTPGDTADANTVAQYLSDTLAPDQVAHFEKVCLEHDLNLAEVSACHQILTLLQAEQIRIPPATRRRMYDLADEPMALPNRKPGRAVSIASIYDETRTNDRGEDDAYLMGLSAMSRRDSARVRYGRLILAAALVSLFAASVYIVWPAASDAPREPISYASMIPGGKPSEVPASATPTPAVPTSKNEQAPLPRIPTTEPPAAETPKETLPPVEPVLKERPPVPGVRTDRTFLGKIERKDPLAVLLRTGPTDIPAAFTTAEESTIASTDRFAVLPGYKATVKLSTEVQVELWGNLPDMVLLSPAREASFTPTLPHAGVDADLTLHGGRFYISGKKPAGSAVRLRIGDFVWDASLMNDKTEIAVEVFGRVVGLAAGVVGIEWTAGLYVVQGNVELRSASGPTSKLVRGNMIARQGDSDTTKLIADAKELPSGDNYWAKNPALSNEGNRGRQLLSILDAIAKDVVLNGGNLKATLAVAVADGDDPTKPDVPQRTAVGIEMFAALGDLNALSDGLTDNKRRWMREASAQGLQRVFAANPGRMGEFRETLLTKAGLGEDLADEAMLLLRDPTPSERGSPEHLDRLFRDLKSPSVLAVPVRELAFQQLRSYVALSDAKATELFLFDAAGTPGARKASVEAWRRKIEELKLPKAPAVPVVPKP